jgi:hypothetical protein
MRISLENSNNLQQAFVIKPLKEEDAQLSNYLCHASGMHRLYGRLEQDTAAVVSIFCSLGLYGSL